MSSYAFERFIGDVRIYVVGLLRLSRRMMGPDLRFRMRLCESSYRTSMKLLKGMESC